MHASATRVRIACPGPIMTPPHYKGPAASAFIPERHKTFSLLAARWLIEKRRIFSIIVPLHASLGQLRFEHETVLDTVRGNRRVHTYPLPGRQRRAGAVDVSSRPRPRRTARTFY